MSRRSQFAWLPSLYFYQALPFFLVTAVTTILYKQFGVSNTWLAIASSVFYFPWVIKPLGGPWVEARGTLRGWIVATQALAAIAAAVAAAFAANPAFLWIASALFLAIAVASVFHDIAAEGMYLAALTPDDQTWFVGVRATFFRFGWLAMQGLFVAWIGWLGEQGQPRDRVWMIGLASAAGFFAVLALIHRFTLPRATSPGVREGGSVAAYLPVLIEFFKQPNVRLILAFLLLFRFGEAQMQKLVMPFFLDPADRGGLGLSTKEVGILFGSFGPFSLTLGGLLGGWVVSKQGLKKWFIPMCVASNVPNALYILLAATKTASVAWIAVAVNAEQFFYGFGFTAYLLFMIETSRRGRYPTAAYAVGTGLMAFGMMIPGAWSGWLEDRMGYTAFFVWAFVCTIPSFWAAYRARELVSDVRGEEAAREVRSAMAGE